MTVQKGGWDHFNESFNSSNEQTVREGMAKAETWKYEDAATLAASGTATTSDVSSFCPFDTLTITEDGGAAGTDWALQMRPGSPAILVVSGAAGTVKVEGDVNGATATLLLADGSTAATTLANGTHYLLV